jgi:hypothetical protein
MGDGLGFFVMMYSQDGNTAMPIMESLENDHEEVMFWPTEIEAHEAMTQHPFAQEFGYEVFTMGIEEEYEIDGLNE